MAMKKWFREVLEFLNSEKCNGNYQAEELLNKGWLVVQESLERGTYPLEKIELPTDFKIALPEEQGGEFDIIELFGERFVKRKKPVDI